jgi:hypothetical protein
VVIATAGCFNGNGNGHDRLPSERRFAPRNNEEAEAVRRMHDAIRIAATLLRDPALSAEDNHRLSRAVDAARWALDHYEALRSRGDTRVFIFAGVKASSAAIVADDVTIVGTGDDILLIPIALAAIATYIFTNSKASSEEIAQAWMQVAQRIQELSTTLDQIVHLTSRGNVADTGIMEEAQELMRTARAPKGDICAALAILHEAAHQANDIKKKRRIERTQKYHDCRHSRKRKGL